MPMRPPRICRCGQLVPSGSGCPTCTAAFRAAYDAKRGSAASRGYDSKWQAARKSYLEKHPECVMCSAQGKRTKATVVDHRIPHRGDKALFWNKLNWQSLCGHHHNSAKQREERRQGGRVDDPSKPQDRRGTIARNNSAEIEIGERVFCL